MKARIARIATEIINLYLRAKEATCYRAPMITLHIVSKERIGLLKIDTFEKSCYSNLSSWVLLDLGPPLEVG